MPDTLLQTPRHGQVTAWFHDSTPLKRGITIANLHTLDTARRYCDRVIGMRDGRIVFDGTPEQLTSGAARDIYGADAGFNEGATSTAISIPDADYAEAMLA